MIYPIIAYGDPVLKKVAEEIPPNREDVPEIISNMYETMYNARGVGLAAPQVGMSIRLFVVDCRGFDDEEVKDFKKVFINPQIVEESGDTWYYEEGCLSIPGIRYDVSRHSKITINYFDENWIEHTETYDGLAARVIQHEYDHIEGVLFVDHLSSIKKRLIKGKLINISKGVTDADYKMKFPVKR